MTHETEQVERVLGALRRQGRSARREPPAEFEVVEALVRLKRRRARVRGGLLAGVSVLAAAALGAVLVRTTSSGSGTASPPPSPVVAAEPAPVAGPSPAAPRRLEPWPGLVVYVERDARVEIAAPGRIDLARGTISLRLRASAGLAIRTPSAEVVVTGTVLAVTADPAGTAVDVLHGEVEVRVAGAVVRVRGGERLEAGAFRPGPLPPHRASRLAELFPPEPASGHVAAADRPGAVSARAAADSEPSPAFPAAPSTPASTAPAVRSSRPTTEPSRLDDAYRRAESALRAGRLAEAAALLRGVLALAPPGSGAEATALLDLAAVCERLGDAACRRDALQRYLDHHPTGALREDARVDLCRILERSGPREPLAACLRAYLAEFPQGRSAPWARGLLEAVGSSVEPARRTGE